MIKIHYHSDCPYFGGCEHMLTNLFNSDIIRNSYIVSFSYRVSAKYSEGFSKRLKRDLRVFPLNIPDLSDFPQISDHLPVFARRFIMAAIRLLCNPLILVCEIVYLTLLFRTLAPDILHINNGNYPGALSARAAAIAGKMAGIDNIIMVVNNQAFGYGRFSRWLDFPIDRLVARCVEQFITGSKSAADRLADVLHLPEGKVISIYNGIEVYAGTSSREAMRSRFGLQGFQGAVFGCVAYFESRKGHDFLLHAIANAARARIGFSEQLKVLLIGDGPQKAFLRQLVSNLNLEDLVTFIEVQDNYVDYMSALDVVVLPSIEGEDFPNVILEAMATERPVIATKIAGIPEQVMLGATGLLVEPRNVEQLESAIFRLLDNPELRSNMGVAAKERFQKMFTSLIAVSAYSKTYRQMIDGQC